MPIGSVRKPKRAENALGVKSLFEGSRGLKDKRETLSRDE